MNLTLHNKTLLHYNTTEYSLQLLVIQIRRNKICREANGNMFMNLLKSLKTWQHTSTVKIKDGGLATSEDWTTNSDGTFDLASQPKICSRGIQPLAFIRSSHEPTVSIARFGSHRANIKPWNPSSHKNPRGKLGRDGVAVNKLDAQLDTGSGPILAERTNDVP